VHDAGVLYVGTGFHHQAAEIPAQTANGANVAPSTNNDVTDQDRRRMDKRGPVDYRANSVNLVTGHCASSTCNNSSRNSIQTNGCIANLH
jgi:hypothetical protein